MEKPLFPGLRANMARKGMTGENIAEFLQITKSSFYSKMKGKTEFKISEIEKLCKLFNADYYELFTR